MGRWFLNHPKAVFINLYSAEHKYSAGSHQMFRMKGTKMFLGSAAGVERETVAGFGDGIWGAADAESWGAAVTGAWRGTVD